MAEHGGFVKVLWFGSMDLVSGMGLGSCRLVVVVSLLISGFFFFLDGFGDWWVG